MKKVLFVMTAAIALFACGGEEKKPEEKTSAATETPKPSTSASAEKALELIGSKGCSPTCHAIDKKVIGPAYIDVSKKYDATPEMIDSLAHKVINGGKGVWGEVPMTPNTSVTLEEAKEMVTYILSLKNQ